MARIGRVSVVHRYAAVPRKGMRPVHSQDIAGRRAVAQIRLSGKKRRQLRIVAEALIVGVQVPARKHIAGTQVERFQGGMRLLIRPINVPASRTLRIAEREGRLVRKQQAPSDAKTVSVADRGEIRRPDQSEISGRVPRVVEAYVTRGSAARKQVHIRVQSRGIGQGLKRRIGRGTVVIRGDIEV